MLMHNDISNKDLIKLIHQQAIAFGGNKELKIYGMLCCQSGKRMKKENRVFFRSGEEALKSGFRPCGHCMNHEFKKWKKR